MARKGFTQHHFLPNATLKKSGAGFTLIELLVVISIIGLLASIALVSLNSARAKARDVKRRADVSQVQKALEFYFDANGVYPPLGVDDNGGSLVDIGPLLSSWLSKIPDDPLGNSWHVYSYVRGPTQKTYGIYLRMEKDGYCKLGIGINPGWWGSGTPICP